MKMFLLYLELEDPWTPAKHTFLRLCFRPMLLQPAACQLCWVLRTRCGVLTEVPAFPGQSRIKVR